MRILAFSILILSFNVCWAGYDKTDWGMSIAQVQKLYPGGVMQKFQNGDTGYNLVRPIGGVSDSLIMFSFRPKVGLRGVTILFPEQGATINLKTSEITPMTDKDCLDTFNLVSNNLKIKYGIPTSDKDEQKAWVTKDNDMIMIETQHHQLQAGKCTVVLDYNKFGDLLQLKSQLTNGL